MILTRRKPYWADYIRLEGDDKSKSQLTLEENHSSPNVHEAHCIRVWFCVVNIDKPISLALNSTYMMILMYFREACVRSFVRASRQKCWWCQEYPTDFVKYEQTTRIQSIGSQGQPLWVFCVLKKRSQNRLQWSSGQHCVLPIWRHGFESWYTNIQNYRTLSIFQVWIKGFS